MHLAGPDARKFQDGHLPVRILVVASETPDQQDARRQHTGQASHESYADTLQRLDGSCIVDSFCCVTGGDDAPKALSAFDGIIFAGSPIQMYDNTPETRSSAAFMERVYRSGTPSFGSCAGLQIAAVAAGGTVKPRDNGMKAGFARRIVPTEAGRTHPMLRGRPATWDAPAMHTTLVDRLPTGGSVLAEGEGTPVEAAEIRHGNGTFWGVQYHPEITLAETADALRRQADALVEEGLVHSGPDAEDYAHALDRLHDDPQRKDIAWQLGLDRQTTEFGLRTIEIGNFLDHIAKQ